MTNSGITRRSFLKTTGALGAVAAATSTVAVSESLFGETVPEAFAEEADKVAWSQCHVNCGGNCIFQWHVRDGKVLYMEPDTQTDVDLQSRPCLRGRSMRKWLNHPDRLLYPMKRVGKRGEGKFERISWDEAIQIIHDNLERIIETYGNGAIHLIYATAAYSSMSHVSKRLLNVLGGYLPRHYDYSANMILGAMPYMYGKQFSPYDDKHCTSFTEAEENSDLVVMFGNSPAETRMGGANVVWDFARLREAVKARGGKIVNIDYRLNETSSGHSEEWLPIRTGTDVALVAAIAHEWIQNDQVDKEYLDKYCVGYDEDTMPESAKGKHRSYKDYIMGTGYDMVEKTPEWAAEITQIPAAKIRELAADIANAKAPAIFQGWGPQRHTNGEEACRAICMLPNLIGKIGLPGTSTGQREAEPGTYLVSGIPAGTNGVKATIPCYMWPNGVDHGSKMTATNAGIKGVDALDSDIKCIWNYAGNCLTNQHSDINATHDLLVDESKCEFILVWDTVMTDSAKYADLLLPDALPSEQLNMQTQGYTEWYAGVTVGGPAQEPPGEVRLAYDVCADIAESFGKREEFTAGRSHDEWVEFLYNQGREKHPEMPTWEQILEQGVYKQRLEPVVGLKSYRDDPVANALQTPSGKIEIYSETLANLNDTWELDDDQEIYPIPLFHGGFQGYGEVTEEFPLYLSGWHHKSRTHSSFGFIEELEQAARQQLWINPADADPRGIKSGDIVAVKSPAGEVRIEARVTNRIIPGTVGMPQGAWHKADMNGDKVDHGACINTLTTYKPTPLAKGNGPAHSVIAQVSKA